MTPKFRVSKSVDDEGRKIITYVRNESVPEKKDKAGKKTGEDVSSSGRKDLEIRVKLP